MSNSQPILKMIEGGKKATSELEEAIAEINRLKLLLKCFIDISQIGLGKLDIIEERLGGKQ
ncbi:hypothetical protein [Avibacterium paragallinarum]|uniref:hypothetical protein n=1 Tax=Avibacterium paragallinarum TaxID=728 RepID=UPI001C9934E8|nr:hypothetical protein [Avibacterium paragallinarum]QZP15587.1 hypothetical protein K5O18_12740 [Avibacterium paragallinarum]QZP16186.1 hypothetical protein K5O18_02155 [Avibacterium paragallinarum]